MNKHRLAFLFLALSVCAGCSTGPEVQRTTASLNILHWNDFHAQNLPFQVTRTDSATGTKQTYSVGGSATMLAYMNTLGRGKENTILLNAGDDFQGTPISSITLGSSQVELMNMIQPDAMVLGNHEFDYGIDELRKNLRSARYPVLASNLYDSTSGSTFAASSLVKTVDGMKLGLIGLLPPDLDGLTMKGTLKGMRLLDMDSVVSTHIKRLRDQEHVDLVIVLSHMGVEEDTMLASRTNGIDVIIGGHTHLPLFTPIKKNKTIVVQAGSRGRYVGQLQLTVDLIGDSVRTYTGKLIETKADVHIPDSAVAAVVARLETLADKALGETIGTLNVEWKRSFTSESNVGNWQADVFRQKAGTQIAFMNSGGLRKDMQPGPITKRDIWEMNPFGNTLVTFNVTGRQLKAMLEWQAEHKGEFEQVSGLTYVFDSSKPTGEKVIAVKVSGRDYEPEATYSVVTNNYVSGHLDKIFGLQETVVLNNLNVVDRDALIEYLIKNPVVTTGVEGRVTDIQANSNNGVHK